MLRRSRPPHIGIAMERARTRRRARGVVDRPARRRFPVRSSSAIRLGRRIYDNLRKAMAFIFAVHVPIAGLALLPLVFGLPLMFSPVAIAFLELIIDLVCSLVFEAERDERDVMTRPPRRADFELFSWPLIGWSVLQGTLAFVLTAAIFVGALRSGLASDEARTLAFADLVVCIVALVLVNRSFSASFVSAFFRPNPALAWIFATGRTCSRHGAALASGVQPVPIFGPLHADDLMVTLGAGLLVLTVLELLKPVWGQRLRSGDDRSNCPAASRSRGFPLPLPAADAAARSKWQPIMSRTLKASAGDDDDLRHCPAPPGDAESRRRGRCRRRWSGTRTEIGRSRAR